MEQNPATGRAYVVDLDNLKPVTPFFIDIAYLSSRENADAGALTLFRGHTKTVWIDNQLGSILLCAGGLSAN